MSDPTTHRSGQPVPYRLRKETLRIYREIRTPSVPGATWNHDVRLLYSAGSPTNTGNL